MPRGPLLCGPRCALSCSGFCRNRGRSRSSLQFSDGQAQNIARHVQKPVPTEPSLRRLPRRGPRSGTYESPTLEMAVPFRRGHDQSSDDRMAVVHRLGCRGTQHRRRPERSGEQRGRRVRRPQRHGRRPGHVLGGDGRRAAAVGADRPRLHRPGGRGEAEASRELGGQAADPLVAGKRRRNQLLDPEDLRRVRLRPRCLQRGADLLPGHTDPLRAGEHHGQHWPAERPALRARGPRRGGFVGEPRRGQDAHREQPHRDVCRSQRQRRQPRQLLGEQEQRPPAVAPGRSGLLGAGRPGGAPAAGRLGTADPDAEGPGQRQRLGVQ